MNNYERPLNPVEKVIDRVLSLLDKKVGPHVRPVSGRRTPRE